MVLILSYEADNLAMTRCFKTADSSNNICKRIRINSQAIYNTVNVLVAIVNVMPILAESRPLAKSCNPSASV